MPLSVRLLRGQNRQPTVGLEFRVRALTTITLMAGFASTVFIPLAGWLVQIQGWRPSLVTLAVIR